MSHTTCVYWRCKDRTGGDCGSAAESSRSDAKDRAEGREGGVAYTAQWLQLRKNGIPSNNPDLFVHDGPMRKFLPGVPTAVIWFQLFK